MPTNSVAVEAMDARQGKRFASSEEQIGHRGSPQGLRALVDHARREAGLHNAPSGIGTESK